MELKEAITKRKSVRRFSDKKISKEQIEEIILAGCQAPSACDKQLWKYIVIDESNLKQRIVDEGGADFIKDSPAGVLVLYGNYTDNNEYHDSIQSGAAAIQNMLLMATSLGIGSCWICHLPIKATMRKLLKIPHCFDPIAYIALGYSALDMPARQRKYLTDSIISWNKFDFKINNISSLLPNLKSLFRNVYFRLPLVLKKILRPIAEKFVKKFDE